MNMLTAAEAHKITKETNLNDLRKGLEKATNQIMNAAKKGKYSTDICINAITDFTINDNDSELFVKALNELGYKSQKIRKELLEPENNKCLYFVMVSW